MGPSTGTRKRAGEMPFLTAMNRSKSVASHFGMAKKIFPNGTITHYLSLAGENQLVWPKANELQRVIRNTDMKNVFHNIANNDKYVLATQYFCRHFQLFICKLSIKKVTTVLRAIMLSFFSNLTKTKQNKRSKAFNAA